MNPHAPPRVLYPDDVMRALKLRGHKHDFALLLLDSFWRNGRDVVPYILFDMTTKEIIFDGNDFAPAPAYAVDGNEAVAGLIGFLTIQAGDTDAEYFKDYTPRQLEFAASYEAADLHIWSLESGYEGGAIDLHAYDLDTQGQAFTRLLAQIDRVRQKSWKAEQKQRAKKSNLKLDGLHRPHLWES